MPALWESSERPMFVRTVWVDGFRHAILNKNDPYLLQQTSARKRRPKSSVSYAGVTTRDPDLLTLRKFKLSRPSQTGDQLEECFRKLHLVFNNERQSRLNLKTLEPPEIPLIEQLDLQDIESVSEEQLVLKASAQPLYEFESSRSKFNSLCIDMRPKASKHEQKEEKDKYDLSERVFQWLDLAGKIDLLMPESDNARIAQQRHSCPEIENKVPHIVFLRGKSSLESANPKVSPKIETPKEDKAKIFRDVDRNIDSPPTPSNAIESYARQSRQVRHTSRNPPLPTNQSIRLPTQRHKTKDAKTNKLEETLPNKNLSQKGGLALKTEKFFSEMDANYETRQKVVSEIYDVERQYTELMSKNPMSDYNRHIKRQVHIFMPPVPKKTAASASTSRTESLLS